MQTVTYYDADCDDCVCAAHSGDDTMHGTSTGINSRPANTNQTSKAKDHCKAEKGKFKLRGAGGRLHVDLLQASRKECRRGSASPSVNGIAPTSVNATTQDSLMFRLLHSTTAMVARIAAAGAVAEVVAVATVVGLVLVVIPCTS